MIKKLSTFYYALRRPQIQIQKGGGAPGGEGGEESKPLVVGGGGDPGASVGGGILRRLGAGPKGVERLFGGGGDFV